MHLFHTAIAKLILFQILLLIFSNVRAQPIHHLIRSPDKKVKLAITLDTFLRYEVFYDTKQIVQPSPVSFNLKQPAVSLSSKTFKKARHQEVNDTIRPVVKEKRAVIPDRYHELTLEFQKSIRLIFRAYDDGIAWRFETRLPDSLTIDLEQVTFHFSRDAEILFPKISPRPHADIFHTSFEDIYNTRLLTDLPEDVLAYTPVLISQPGMPKLVVTESDVFDYPGMFLEKGEGNSMKGVFAPYPLKDSLAGDEFKLKTVTKRASYIARTTGNRLFPWRVIAIAPTDAGLLINDLVYRLARTPQFSGYDWIKPGKSTEEWITGSNLYGVDFESGINTATYQYYIDFAARFGFEYVMLDAGWSDVNDLFSIRPGMDMEKITSYAQQKGVGLILWTQASTIERQWKAILPQFKKWGIRIIMTDFIDRNDQTAMQFMEWFAGECAKEQLMCMIHGSPVPAGFSRTYPNMLTREGALGSEYNIWSANANPEHDLLIPFIRMLSGPMDYEPGLMQHATAAHPVKMGFEKVIAQGTRMHQMAMFIVYESPLQLFSGNISDAFREPELMELVGKIPTTWDETLILEASLGQYIVEARRLGNDWYIAAMNDWSPAEFLVDLNFLPEGVFQAEIARDGINAAKNPHDYKMEYLTVSRNDRLAIRLAPGGGYIARITRP